MRATLLLLALLLTVGCVEAPEQTPTPTPAPMMGGRFAVTSAAFDDGGAIPQEHTCDGAETSPPLAIVGAPAGAVTVALIMADPDVPIPQAPQRNLTHWLVWNVPLVNGTATFEAGSVPEGAIEGAGDASDRGYGGPCPPAFSTAHRYVFTLFAVDGALDLEEGAARDELEAALQGRTVGETSLTGTYARALPP